MSIHYFALSTTKRFLQGIGVCSSREINKLKQQYGDALQLIPKEEYDKLKKKIRRPKAFRKFKVERCDLKQMV